MRRKKTPMAVGIAGLLALALAPAISAPEQQRAPGRLRTLSPPARAAARAASRVNHEGLIQLVARPALEGHHVAVSLHSLAAGQLLQPGEVVEWSLHARAMGPGLGLAYIMADLIQHSGNPQLMELPPGDGAPAAMQVFDRPLGFANPGMGAAISAYGGTPQKRGPEHADLLQIGGMQNIFGMTASCLGPQKNVCQGQATEIQAKVGVQGGGLAVATGRFTAPQTPGRYLFFLSGVRAAVLDATVAEGPAVSVAAAVISTAGGSLSFEVAGGPIAMASGESLKVPRGAESVRPAEGSDITYIHVRFRWPSPPAYHGGWLLSLVKDDGAPDPFASQPALVQTHWVDGREPRFEVRSGLSFGNRYAWRLTTDGGTLPLFSSIHRFRIKPLPPEIPPMQIRRPEAGEMQPGITFFNLDGRSDSVPPGALALAVDEAGQVIFFLHHPDADDAAGYAQIMASGRIILLRGLRPGESRGSSPFEETLGGRVVWAAPADRGYDAHHDVDFLPDGSVLLLLKDPLLLPEDGGILRVGDRLAILERQSRNEIWSWRTIDHYSTQDGLQPPPRWTHGNAANYSSLDNSIYFSSRHLSRITKIDVASGEILYNMGAAQPSGDTDFGSGLFSYQHAPELQPGGTLLLFDNGNKSFPAISRVIEVEFDNPRMPTSARIVWEYAPVGPFGTPTLSFFGGDADRLPNGNTLLAMSPFARITEVTPDGKEVWRFTIGSGFPASSLYRAQRLPSLHVDTPGDHDGDQDLDLTDLADLHAMAGTGKDAALTFPGYLSDMNSDGWLDRDDLEAFQRWMTGPVE